MEREHFTRPKKSVRRSLWKGARRASAMIALGMTAASSYVTETMPPGKPTDQVSLLEVGGIELTCDNIEAGFRTIEPLTWDDYLSPGQALNVHDTLSFLKPRVLWFQGNTAEHTSEITNRVMATADHQLSLGGAFVYQARCVTLFGNILNSEGFCMNNHTPIRRLVMIGFYELMPLVVMLTMYVVMKDLGTTGCM